MLTVPLAGSTAFGTTANLAIRFTTPIMAPRNVVPQVIDRDAESAMRDLTRIAAGGSLGVEHDGVVTWETTLDANDIADYKNVTAGICRRRFCRQVPRRMC